MKTASFCMYVDRLYHLHRNYRCPSIIKDPGALHFINNCWALYLHASYVHYCDLNAPDAVAAGRVASFSNAELHLCLCIVYGIKCSLQLNVLFMPYIMQCNTPVVKCITGRDVRYTNING